MKMLNEDVDEDVDEDVEEKKLYNLPKKIDNFFGSPDDEISNLHEKYQIT